MLNGLMLLPKKVTKNIWREASLSNSCGRWIDVHKSQGYVESVVDGISLMWSVEKLWLLHGYYTILKCYFLAKSCYAFVPFPDAFIMLN